MAYRKNLCGVITTKIPKKKKNGKFSLPIIFITGPGRAADTGRTGGLELRGSTQTHRLGSGK
jgi:hypothetical protein